MPKSAGRKFLIMKGGTAIAGVRQTGMTVNGSTVNVEDQNDEGFYRALEGVKTGRRIEITGEGYEDGQVLRDAALSTDAAATFFTDITLEFPNGDTITGNMVLEAYSETGSHEDGLTFSGTISTSGPWVYAKAGT